MLDFSHASPPTSYSSLHGCVRWRRAFITRRTQTDVKINDKTQCGWWILRQQHLPDISSTRT